MKINLSTITAVIWTVYLVSCIIEANAGTQPTWISVILPTILLVFKYWMDVICDEIIASAIKEKEEDDQDK